ncbi:MAG: hypothetical protein GY810_10050 [Aureispira sp.]|nr:hypothetical protein [Aureispira sp.]
MFGNIIIVIVGIIVAIIIGFFLLVAQSHKKVAQGKALIRTGMGGAKVALDSGMFVIPVLHKLEEIDISLKTVTIECMNEEGLICKDNLRADIKMIFYVRVNKDKKDIIEVAQTIGCERASTQETFDHLFHAKFLDAMRMITNQFDFNDLYADSERFRMYILETIGTDLNGYILDDCAIEHLAQTPIEALNPNHITDAKAIKKIQEITAAEMIEANNIISERDKTIKDKELETQGIMLAYEQEKAKREVKHKAEMDKINAQKNKSDSIYDRL